MSINQEMLSNFKEELDEVSVVDLPDDLEFAKNIAKQLEPSKALEAIEAYTWYVSCRTNEITK